MSVIISIDNVTKKYKYYNSTKDRLIENLSLFKKVSKGKEFYAVKEFSTKIQKGECIGIIGKNGSGKSTLLKMITGVLTPSSGEINVYGNISALLELGTGFNPDYTGIENIYANSYMLGYTKKEVDSNLQSIIDFADIGNYINQPVKYYSSGMYARLAFSVAISGNPDILIADEILSVGDINFQNKCIEKMKEMQKSGTTILFVSHDLHAVKYFCDRAIWINEGEKILDSNDVIKTVDKYERNILSDVINEQSIISNTNSDSIQIVDTWMEDSDGDKRNTFSINEKFKVNIKYVVNKEISNIFFGVGVRNSRGVYVTGLNTKLDDFNLELKKGTHVLTLEYNNINLYKDVYTLWSVCYNSTGTVVLSDFIIKNAFEIVSRNETGEGIIIPDHSWRY